MTRRFVFLVASCIASVALLAGCNEGSSTPAPSKPSDPIPPPTKLRTDLLYGYFGDSDGQVEETQDHVNLQFVAGWGKSTDAWENIITRLKEAQAAGIKHIVLQASSLYLDRPEERLRWEFDQLRGMGLLANIDAMYPVDEPDTAYGYSAEKIIAANTLLRKVMADYPELKDTKIAVIYGSKSKWPGIESYDWIGFDDYDRGDSVLTGQYLDLLRHMKPGQKTILVPGGADPWCQDPDKFFRQAEVDPLVAVLMPFVWFDHYDNTANKGIRSNACRQRYVDTGRRVINH